MTYTPVELRHVRVRRSLLGYHRPTVEQVIEEVAQSFEATWRERGELAEKVEQLEKQLGEHKRREELLTQTLVAAEQAASDVRERARREADAIIAEAHNEARAIGRSAHAKREQLLAESQRIEAMLRSALGVLEGGSAWMPLTTLAPQPASRIDSAPAPVAAPKPAAQGEPSMATIPTLPPVIDDAPAPSDDWRQDTREFAPIVEPQARFDVVEPQARFDVAEPLASFDVAEPETTFALAEPRASFDVPEPPIVEGEASIEGPDAEPELEPVAEAPAEPVLQRTPGRESRDFDWGE
jgi:cell division initiation protein